MFGFKFIYGLRFFRIVCLGLLSSIFVAGGSLECRKYCMEVSGLMVKIFNLCFNVYTQEECNK